MTFPPHRNVFVLVYSCQFSFFGFPIRCPSDFPKLEVVDDVFPTDLIGFQYICFFSDKS